MSADLTISNEALIAIGARSTITDINESSTEAAACRLLYDPSRQIVLRSNDWAFARKQAALATSAGSAIIPFDYRYTYPADCIAFRRILPASGAGALDASKRRRFVVQSDAAAKIILSNVPNAIGIYTYDAAIDQFEPMARYAVVLVLASRLVMALTGNVTLDAAATAKAQNIIQNAELAAMNETNSNPKPLQPLTQGAPSEQQHS